MIASGAIVASGYAGPVDGRLGVLAVLVLAACVRTATPAPYVTGVFGVAEWSTDQFSASWCERCPGGPTIHAIADSPDRSLAIFVELDADRCGADGWTTELWPIGDARISYG